MTSTTATIPWWTHEFIEDRTPMRTLGCVGGIGSGKSHGSAIWDIARCLENGTSMKDPIPTVSWAVAPRYHISENSLIPSTIKTASEVFGLKAGKHFTFLKSQPRKLSFAPMGINHLIEFLSADNPQFFVAASITHWRWTEAAVSKPEVFDKLQDRLRDKRAKVLQGLVESAPEGLNHFYDLMGFGGDATDAVDDARNFRRVRIETGDNVDNLAPGYLEMLRARYGYSRERLLSYERGIFTSLTKSTAFWEWVESRNVVSADEVPPSPHVPLIHCWDFNVYPLCYSVMQRHECGPLWNRSHRYATLWESSGESRGIEHALEEFARAFPVSDFRDTPILLYGDRSGFQKSPRMAGNSWTQIRDKLHALGYTNVTIKALEGVIGIQESLEKVAALMAYGQYVVSSKCPKTINAFAKTALVDGTWDLQKGGPDDPTHRSDGPRYALFALTRTLNVYDPKSGPLAGFMI